MTNKLQNKKVWLTIDTDDLNHHPSKYGHPKRTKNNTLKSFNTEPSSKLIISMEKFREWFFQDPSKRSVTLFVIAEQLESKIFSEWLTKLLLDSENENGEILVGCHSYRHKCWSAWGEEYKNEFKEDLIMACSKISSVVGDSWRPWFRAPGGYIAPWMAKVLKECNIELDTSINPVSLLIRKTGKSKNKKWNGWQNNFLSMQMEEIVEREWFTSKLLGIKIPCCGPALHLPFIRYFSNKAWSNLLNSYHLATENQIMDLEEEVITLYWHLLDYSRNNGNWNPPFL